MTQSPSPRRKRSHSGSDKRERSGKPILVRLTPEERAAAEAAASRAGLSLAGFTRGQILGQPGPRAVRRAPVERQALARVLGQLGKIGSNLNQIARAANVGAFSPADRDELAGQLRALRAARDALMEALGRTP